MLPRADRLRHMKDFALLSQKGRVVFHPLFTLRFRPNGGQTKIGFVASNKLFRRANKRNRAKRRMRAVLAELRAKWPASLDLLFMLKPEVLDAEYPALLAGVERVFEKIPEAMLHPPKQKPPRARRKTSVVYKGA